MRRIIQAARAAIVTAVLLLVGAPPAQAALGVTLEVTPNGLQYAGRPVMMKATATGTSESVDFQFSYRPLFGAWRLISEFYYVGQVEWVTLNQGWYDLRVIARVTATGETAEAVAPMAIGSFGQYAPTVSATTHPLVAVYSAPPCGTGVIWVRFRRQGAAFWQQTTAQLCTAGRGVNFYVAGLRGDTSYAVQQVVVRGAGVEFGPELTFRSGVPAVPLPTLTVDTPPTANTSFLESTVLKSVIGNTPTAFPIAADLTGAVIWYYPLPTTTLTRPVFGGTMLVLVRDGVSGRILREIDLQGAVVRETNAIEVSRQLQAMGHDPIGVFHHEAIRLPNGHTLAIASVERILVDEQGPGAVHVYGEMIVALDQNLQVVWAWNAFDHLDRTRVALLGETCTFEGPGCPALFLGPLANDWLHANAIGYDAGDGNLILSLRHQDWVVKIDYQNGLGNGGVLWRLGDGGDFTLSASTEAWPWFSHQHDARLAGGRMLLYDNGNVRVETLGTGNSRGQVFQVDEVSMTATLETNLDLGAYASALGSGQPLMNGNYHFDNGFLGTPANPSGEALEVRGSTGARVYSLRTNAFVYRSFRMTDLYRP